MSRIQAAFQGRKAFIAFITCGDPDLETTKAAVKAAAANGADLIELGIPFSDPTAEGPVIQAANMRALQNGITTDQIFAFVHDLRKEVDVPLVFMTYANVVFSYGTAHFSARCADCGIDGIILPDVPFEEKGEFEPYCRAQNIDLISMIAPTSGERIAAIASEASGFLYVVSSMGVTGMRKHIDTDLTAMIQTVRAHTDIPCAIGFGISDPTQAAAMARIADGAIVGSAIVRLLAQHGKQAPQAIGTFVRAMKEAMQGKD